MDIKSPNWTSALLRIEIEDRDWVVRKSWCAFLVSEGLSYQYRFVSDARSGRVGLPLLGLGTVWELWN